jgi:hypothetical protein
MSSWLPANVRVCSGATVAHCILLRTQRCCRSVNRCSAEALEWAVMVL